MRLRLRLGRCQRRLQLTVGLQRDAQLLTQLLLGRQLLGRLLYWAIFIFYLVLPSVSRSIFSARLCESFGYDDATGQRISYLLADPSRTCDAGPTWDDETGGLAPYFWAFFALWPVLVPLGFLALLLRVRKPVAAQRATPLSRATSFLWRDYSARFLFWEVLDLVRELQELRGLTVVAVLHDLAQAARCADRIVALRDGRVHADGAPGDVVDDRLLAEVFGLRARPSVGRLVCGQVMSMIRSATHLTRATWILPMSKDFVREKTDW